jgi:thioredoxin-related protein
MIYVIKFGGDKCGPVKSYDQIADQFEQSFRLKNSTEFNDFIEFKDVVDETKLEVLMKREKVLGIPCTVILSETGKQIGKIYGMMSKDALCDVLTSMLYPNNWYEKVK